MHTIDAEKIKLDAKEDAPSKFKALFAVRMPTEAESRQSAEEWYARVGWSFIDRWPPDVAALSVPTTFVRVDARRLARLWEHTPDYGVAQETADLLDATMGWRQWFVRLNSRSPKDVFPPDSPFTCSGKQAVSWIMCSERCLDDIVLFSHIEEPLFICLREPRQIFKDEEFRCFAKDGNVIGVSRYHYNIPAEYPGPSDEYLFHAAQTFYKNHLERHYSEVVFDLCAPGVDRCLLIEVNPYGLSDPCCFGSYGELEARPGVRLVLPDVGEPSCSSTAADSSGNEMKQNP